MEQFIMNNLKIFIIADNNYYSEFKMIRNLKNLFKTPRLAPWF